jgi:hypothetical protein
MPPRIPPVLNLTAATLSPLYTKSADSLQHASAALAGALSLPLSPGRDNRLSLEADACDAVALEFVVAAAGACVEAGMDAHAAALCVASVYRLLCRCAGAEGGWPSLKSASSEWDVLLSELLSGDGSGEGESAAEAALVTASQAAAVDSWLRNQSLLLPHHYEMHRVLWTTGAGVSAPLCRIVRPIVVPPPPRASYEPLSHAREV